MKSLLANSFLNAFFKILFIAVNAIFIYKYGLRQDLISVNLILIIYLICTILFLFKDLTNSYIYIYKFQKLDLKFCFKILVLIVAFIIFLITFFTDGTTLNVDRWSAMDVAINALLNGDYPYTATDHLGGRTSNFPGLLVLGIPFYFLGSVGYLQVFSFLLLSYTLYKNVTIEQAFKYLILLILSPAFWWEIFSISDLMSNVFICFCFVLWWKSIFKNNLFSKPYLLGFSTAFLILTRGIVAIPLSLMFFKPFCAIDLKLKFKVILSFIITFLFLIFIVIVNVPSIDILKNFNPLVLQSSYLPATFHYFVLIIPFYFSFRIKNFDNQFYKYAVVLIFFPMIVSFCFLWKEYGFNEIIQHHKSDLSYLSLVFPFLLYEISKNTTKTTIAN